MRHEIGPRAALYPTVVWLVIIALLFGTEYLIMLALPIVFASEPSPLVEALIDSLAITAVLAPIIWLALVRPLRNVARLRSRIVSDQFAAIETERRKTATELHDGIGQELGLLISGLRSAQAALEGHPESARVRSLEALAKSALTQAKRIAMGLRPSVLDDLGLAEALEKVIADAVLHTSIELKLHVASLAGVRLAEPIETGLFRVFQEVLANIIRHSGATHAVFDLVNEGGRVTLSVRDDGRGFDPREVARRPADEGHTGLIGMRERVTLLGGNFDLRSSPGGGCSISVSLPAEVRAP